MISEIGYCMKQGKLQHFNLQFIGTEFYTYQEIKFCRMNEPFRFGNWWKTISQPFQNGCKTLFIENVGVFFCFKGLQKIPSETMNVRYFGSQRISLAEQSIHLLK